MCVFKLYIFKKMMDFKNFDEVFVVDSNVNIFFVLFMLIVLLINECKVEVIRFDIVLIEIDVNII